MNNLVSIAPLYERSLSHSGIKGMKWGIRRYQNPDGTLTEEGKRRYRRQEARQKKLEDAKNVGYMKASELDKKIRRLEQEKRLKNLTDELYNPGKKTVMDLLQTTGGRVAATAIAGAALYSAKALISKKFEVDELADAVFRGGARKK